MVQKPLRRYKKHTSVLVSWIVRCQVCAFFYATIIPRYSTDSKPCFIVLDGFAATRQIREMEAKGQLSGRLPIIALTANVTQDSEAECRLAGMDHFLPKPLKIAGQS